MKYSDSKYSKRTRPNSQIKPEPSVGPKTPNSQNPTGSERRLTNQSCYAPTRAYLWPGLLALAIFTASGAQQLATPDLGFQFSKDKLGHFLVFGLLATAILRTPKLRDLRQRSLLMAALIASLYGGFDEVRQSFTPGRSVELADWLADTLGALVAVLVYARWHSYRRLLEWKARGGRKATQT
ncbi:MAG: VanZ family protein [Puniceicoccaceae bacterium]|nr:VanZ family protein [Puniceicoccaceae bacterium]